MLDVNANPEPPAGAERVLGERELFDWRPHSNWLSSVQFVQLAVGGCSVLTTANDGHVKLWDLTKQHEGVPKLVASSLAHHRSGIFAAHCSGHGRRFSQGVRAFADPLCRAADGRQGCRRKTVSHHAQRLFDSLCSFSLLLLFRACRALTVMQITSFDLHNSVVKSVRWQHSNSDVG